MSRPLIAIVSFLMLIAVADLRGQDPPRADQRKATDQASSDKLKMGEVSVTGCLEAGSTAGQYKLTHATQVSGLKEKGLGVGATTNDANQKAQNAAQTAAKDAMKGTAMTGDWRISFDLVSGSTDLQPHVGHKVEVTGTVSKEDMMTMERLQHDQSKTDKEHGKAEIDPKKADKPAHAAKPGQSTQADQTMPQSAMSSVKLNVTSMKHISPTCP